MLEHLPPILTRLAFYLSGMQRRFFDRAVGELAIFNTVDRSTGFKCQNSFPYSSLATWT